MSWTQNMADVIREVIFQDEELKRLMMIPESDQPSETDILSGGTPPGKSLGMSRSESCTARGSLPRPPRPIYLNTESNSVFIVSRSTVMTRQKIARCTGGI